MLKLETGILPSSVKKPFFLPPRFKLLLLSDLVVVMWAKSFSEFSTNYPGSINC